MTTRRFQEETKETRREGSEGSKHPASPRSTRLPLLACRSGRTACQPVLRTTCIHYFTTQFHRPIPRTIYRVERKTGRDPQILVGSGNGRPSFLGQAWLSWRATTQAALVLKGGGGVPWAAYLQDEYGSGALYFCIESSTPVSAIGLNFL